MAIMIDQRDAVQQHLSFCRDDRVSAIEPADKDCKGCGFYPIPRRRVEECAHAIQSRYVCPECKYDFAYSGGKGKG